MRQELWKLRIWRSAWLSFSNLESPGTAIHKFPISPEKVPAGLLQPSIQSCRTREQRESAEFSEARGALAVAVLPRRDNGQEGHAGIPRGQRIVNVVAEIKRRDGISAAKNFLQAFGVRFPFRVVHGNDGAKISRCRPAFERKRKLLPRAPGEKIQFKPLRPPFNLFWGYHQFFVSNVARLPVAAPIKPLERYARFLISGWVAERTYPRGHHGPIIIEAGLALPRMQLGIRDALPGDVAHRLQRRAPVRSAHVNENAVHIEDQDFRWRAFFRGRH